MPEATDPKLATIRGRCVDENGAPLAGCEVKVAGWERNDEDTATWLVDHAKIDWQDPPPLTTGNDGAFSWLHSIDDPSLALPVANPWHFFADYAVELSDEDSAPITADPADVAVWVTVRAGAELADFYASQLPCAEVTITGATLTVEYGANGVCTHRGQRYTGTHTVTVSRNDESDVVVLEGLKVGDRLVTGPYRALKKLKDGEAVRKRTDGKDKGKEQGTDEDESGVQVEVD